MRSPLILAALLACLAVPARAAPASPEAVIAQFAANFTPRDVAAQAALFRPDALIFGSTAAPLLRGPDGAREYFGRAWATGTGATVTCEPAAFLRPAPGLVLFATTCRVARGEVVRGLRLSGTLQQDTDGWRFAEFHGSAPPP
jgi:ketosteroid isomerase-like protein